MLWLYPSLTLSLLSWVPDPARPAMCWLLGISPRLGCLAYAPALLPVFLLLPV